MVFLFQMKIIERNLERSFFNILHWNIKSTNLIFEKIWIFFSNNIYSIQIRKESKTTLSRFSPSNNRIDLENSFSESEIQRKRNC